jgi:diguanylate cyclase (GGDEF)-like protein/PAS domain S-box-containing protein
MDMNYPLLDHLLPDARRTTLILASILVLSGLLVLLGWVLDISSLTKVFPGFPSMKVNTALGFGMAGLGLFSCQCAKPCPVTVRVWPGLILLLGSVLTLLEYWQDTPFSIDQWLIADTGTTSEFPGRPSMATAFSFFMAALVLLHQTFTNHSKPMRRILNILIVLGCSPSMIGIFTYLYQPAALFGVEPFATMALHTCVGFVLFFYGIVLSCRDSQMHEMLFRQSEGGRHFRMLLIPILIFPIVCGWLLQLLVSNQYLHPAFAIALFAALCSLVSVGALAWSARSMDAWTRRLQQETEAKQLAETKMALVWGSVQAAAILFDSRGRVHEINPGAVALFGWPYEALKGKPLRELIPERVLTTQTPKMAIFIADPDRTFYDLDDPAQLRVLTRTGEEIPVIASVSKHMVQGEMLIGAVLIRVPQLAATLDRLRDESFRDGLTGVENRKSLDLRVARINRFGLRNERRLGLLMLDIDHFKRVNDRYGHAIGDLVLQEFAIRVGSALRAEDNLYRYGGEEFLAMVWFRHPNELVRVAARIRQNVVATPILDKPPIELSCSMGIAAIEHGELGTTAAFERADAALYRAKANGRDCFVLDIEPDNPPDIGHTRQISDKTG